MSEQRLEYAFKTDKGRVRPHNEDAVAVYPQTGLVIVADGIGGANAGEVASHLAIETVSAHFQDESGPPADADEAMRRAQAAVAAANRAIWEAARATPSYSGMGTTLVIGYARDDWLAFAHVGDSRLYRLRDGRLEQLTSDHSLIQEVVDRGFFRTLEHARRYGINQNILTRGLGSALPVAADCDQDALSPGDLYLFCTDGLTGMVPDEVIRQILLDSDDLEQLSTTLIDAANAGGGMDNITVALLRVSA